MTEYIHKRPGRERTTEATPVRALNRGLDVLDMLAKSEGASLSEVSRQAKLVPSTAYRILETLTARRYVEYSADQGIYRLGMRVFEVGHAYSRYNNLKEQARLEMFELAEKTSEGVNLAVLDGEEVVYVHQEQGNSMMRMFTQEGARAPVYCTGVGKCLLAWMPEESWAAHLPDSPYPRFTPFTITEESEFYATLRQVKAQGFATDAEEREEGVFCMTAPIFGSDGKVVAGLSLSGPSTRMERLGTDTLQKMVTAAAARISDKLMMTTK